MQYNSSSSSAIAIKSEPVYIAEEANVIRQYQRDAGKQERSEPVGSKIEQHWKEQHTKWRVKFELYIVSYLKRCKSKSIHNIEIPNTVLAFESLDCAGLELGDKQSVFNDVDCNESERF